MMRPVVFSASTPVSPLMPQPDRSAPCRLTVEIWPTMAALIRFAALTNAVCASVDIVGPKYRSSTK